MPSSVGEYQKGPHEVQQRKTPATTSRPRKRTLIRLFLHVTVKRLALGIAQFYTMAAPTLPPPLPPTNSRPGSISRAMTAPDKMAVNGHFASAGQDGKANFEHGIQVIDEDKEFKCVLVQRSCTKHQRGHLALTIATVQIFRNTYSLPVLLLLASTII